MLLESDPIRDATVGDTLLLQRRFAGVWAEAHDRSADYANMRSSHWKTSDAALTYSDNLSSGVCP
jgi:hypothetical protein